MVSTIVGSFYNNTISKSKLKALFKIVSLFFLNRLQNQCERHTQGGSRGGGRKYTYYVLYLEESLSYFSVVSLDPTKQVGTHFKYLL